MCKRKQKKVRIKVKFCTRIITQTSYVVPRYGAGIRRYLRTVYLASRTCHCREDLRRRKGQKNVHQTCPSHFAQTFSGPLPFPWSSFLYSILNPFQVIKLWCTKVIMAYALLSLIFVFPFYFLTYFIFVLILFCLVYNISLHFKSHSKQGLL